MRLVWTRLALDDLDHARDFIEAANPPAVLKVVERIESAVATLAAHPEMGRPGRFEGTRELIVVGTPFIVPYRVHGDRIEILGIIHGARRWPGGP